MRQPVSIEFRGMEGGAELERAIRERSRALDRFGDRVLACGVTVEAVRRRPASTVYRVRVRVVLPGAELVASSGSGPRDEPTHPHTAIRAAFHAALRLVQQETGWRPRDVRSQPGPARRAGRPRRTPAGPAARIRGTIS